MRKRLMILGASRYYVRSILAAKELGCEVLVVDRNPEAEGFRYADRHEVMDISDLEGSLSVAEKYDIEGVVPVNDFGVKTAAFIAEEMGIVGISRRIAEYSTSKAWMRKIWKKAGVPSAKFTIVKTLKQAEKAVQKFNAWPIIFKPVDSRGGGSRGVSVIDNIDGIEEAFKFAQSFYQDKNVVIEEFLSGSEHSIETLTFEGITHILAVSDKVKTDPPYRVDKSVIYPTKRQGSDLERIKNVAKEAIGAIGICCGPVHVELCFTKNGPRLFEIGARCGGGGTPDPIVPFLTGIDMFKEVIRIALGERPKNITPRYSRASVYRFLTPRPGMVKGVTGQEQVKKWPNILDCEVLVGEGDGVNPIKVGADRAGFIITGGDTSEQAMVLADLAEQHIQFSYYGVV